MTDSMIERVARAKLFRSFFKSADGSATERIEHGRFVYFQTCRRRKPCACPIHRAATDAALAEKTP